MEGTPTLTICFLFQKIAEKDQQFQLLCKNPEQCLLLKSLLGGTISELLRRFSQQEGCDQAQEAVRSQLTQAHIPIKAA